MNDVVSIARDPEVRATLSCSNQAEVPAEARASGSSPDQALAPAPDPDLVRALKAGMPYARAELFDRYGAHIQRVLTHVLGYDLELADLLHEVFARALAGVDRLREEDQLKAWLTRIAVFTARGCLRARARRRWLRFDDPQALPELSAQIVPDEVLEAMRCTYLLLERLPTEERIVFTLRFIDGMELEHLAATCGVSLSTIKRRLARAERRFVTLARNQPALRSWIEEGSRWGRV